MFAIVRHLFHANELIARLENAGLICRVDNHLCVATYSTDVRVSEGKDIYDELAVQYSHLAFCITA